MGQGQISVLKCREVQFACKLFVCECLVFGFVHLSIGNTCSAVLLAGLKDREKQ